MPKIWCAMQIPEQLPLIPDYKAPPFMLAGEKLNQRSGTFIDNMKLPIHRWFRYSAGFSADWVCALIAERQASAVLDPFAGSGTVSIAADSLGVPSCAVEAHPFVYRLALAKTFWDAPPDELLEAARDLKKKAQAPYYHDTAPTQNPLLAKCYSESALLDLFKIKNSWAELKCSETIHQLLFLAISAILRPCSHVGTAQWQYVLPNKSKARIAFPLDAFDMQIELMADDMRSFRFLPAKALAKLYNSDSRTLREIPDASVDMVITSPPYANNYDYADATRLEMTFWGEVASWSDLHNAVRKNLICSNSQHASLERFRLDSLLDSAWLTPISDEIAEVCAELVLVRETKGGKKHYHTMIAAYFQDMSQTLFALRRVLKNGGQMCLVIGDSAPYGVHVPVDKWLGRLAQAWGFSSVHFEKLRDRNTKWKNRKHTVPLHEGRLWING